MSGSFYKGVRVSAGSVRIWAKKMGKEAVGRGIDWGFSSPHTLLPKEEKEEKMPFCSLDVAKKVP